MPPTEPIMPHSSPEETPAPAPEAQAAPEPHMPAPEPSTHVPVTPPPTHGARRSAPSQKLLIGLITLVFIVVVAVLIAAAVHHTKPTSTSSTTVSSVAPAAVSITSKGFVPATIDIKPGQTVVWTNNDSVAHQVASDPYPTDNNLAGFKDPTSLTPGEEYSFVFPTAGKFTYHDNLNPYTLKGEVVVQ